MRDNCDGKNGQKQSPTSSSGIDTTTDEIYRSKTKDFLTSFDPLNTLLYASLITHDPPSEILKLLKENPQSTLIANKSGDLPLHYDAMDKQCIDIDVLDQLLKLNPSACSQYNSYRSLPLHLHCMIGAPSLYFVKKMLELFPAGACIQSEVAVVFKGVAVNKDPPSSIYEFATEHFCLEFDFLETVKYLTGVSFKDEDGNGANSMKLEVGWSPLHLAVYNGAPIEVVEELLRVAPQSANLRTNQNRTALDCGNDILHMIEKNQIGKQNKSNDEIRMLSLMKQNVLNTKLAVNLLKRSSDKNTSQIGEGR